MSVDDGASFSPVPGDWENLFYDGSMLDVDDTGRMLLLTDSSGYISPITEDGALPTIYASEIIGAIGRSHRIILIRAKYWASAGTILQTSGSAMTSGPASTATPFLQTPIRISSPFTGTRTASGSCNPISTKNLQSML